MNTSAMARLRGIAAQEKLDITDQALDKVMTTANGDLRQALSILQMWSRSTDHHKIDYIEANKKLTGVEKDIEISPFSAIKTLMTGVGVHNLSDRLDMYFVDYGLMSLFVQENYINNKPLPHNDLRNVDPLEAACKAAEFISDGDLVDRVVRSQMRWDLLNTHGMLSSVAPSYYMQGAMGMPVFPGWLGKNSTFNKRNRLLTELQMHMRSVVSADKAQVMLDYLPALQLKLTKPLIEEGTEAIDSVIETMDEYCISRDDWDSVMELGRGGCEDILKQIPTAVKSTFTRRYNAESHLAKMGAVFSKMAPNRSMAYEYEEEEPSFLETESQAQGDDEEQTQESEEGDLKADKLIKAPKPKAAKSAGKAGAKGKGKAPEKSSDTKGKKASKK